MSKGSNKFARATDFVYVSGLYIQAVLLYSESKSVSVSGTFTLESGAVFIIAILV